jgi:hypothetical protein
VLHRFEHTRALFRPPLAVARLPLPAARRVCLPGAASFCEIQTVGGKRTCFILTDETDADEAAIRSGAIFKRKYRYASATHDVKEHGITMSYRSHTSGMNTWIGE